MTRPPRSSGVKGYQAAQCFRCGDAVQILGGDEDSVTLSVVAMMQPQTGADITITLWAHPACHGSQVFTGEEFEAMADPGPSPVGPEAGALFVDGRRIL